MKEPLISIITPTYNHEAYIEKCIKSVIAQSYQHWEMLILDDGSTDNTAQIALKYSDLDSRIKYFYQENVGLKRLKESYNFLLSKSTGDYIAILESDDFWFENKLETQIQYFLEKPDLVLCWSRVNVWLDDTRYLLDYPRFFDSSKLDYYTNTPNGSIFNMLFEDFPVPLSWLINKKKLIEIGGFLQTFGMPTVDLNTLLVLSQKGDFAYVNQSLGVYRKQYKQATSIFILDIANGKEKIILDYYDNLTEEQKKLIIYNRSEIKSKLVENRILAFSKQGRSFLVQKKFKEARKSYVKSLTILGSTSLMWRLRSLIGLVFSLLRLNVEGLARALKKETLN